MKTAQRKKKQKKKSISFPFRSIDARTGSMELSVFDDVYQDRADDLAKVLSALLLLLLLYARDQTDRPPMRSASPSVSMLLLFTACNFVQNM